MTTAGWFVLIGGLMLVIGMANNKLSNWPITAAMVYLCAGLIIGPTGLALFHFNPLQQSSLLEIVTEVVVLISLFSAGVKMPTPFSGLRWRTPILLATVSMSITVGLVAALAWGVFGFSIGAAVLLGAIVAPTDPVLATDVQTRHAEDRDRLRFNLTCEAGMNDGSAFPFVMLGLGLLGLHELGDHGLRWVLVDVVWATCAGVAIGVICGIMLGRASVHLQRRFDSPSLLVDFLALGLIGVVYGLSLWAHAWGFLAVFFAAVALRQTELKLADGDSDQQTIPAKQRISEASLIFKEHLERLSVLVLVLLVGGMLFINSWSWRATLLALFTFAIARPVSVAIGLMASRSTWRIKGLISWFGVRGIGSLFYLMYAIEHGLDEALAVELIHFTLVIVTLSIVVHGTSVKPILDRLWRR